MDPQQIYVPEYIQCFIDDILQTYQDEQQFLIKSRRSLEVADTAAERFLYAGQIQALEEQAEEVYGSLPPTFESLLSFPEHELASRYRRAHLRRISWDMTQAAAMVPFIWREAAMSQEASEMMANVFQFLQMGAQNPEVFPQPEELREVREATGSTASPEERVKKLGVCYMCGRSYCNQVYHFSGVGPVRWDEEEPEDEQDRGYDSEEEEMVQG